MTAQRLHALVSLQYSLDIRQLYASKKLMSIYEMNFTLLH